MELNITHLFAEGSAFVPFDLSNNQATLGADAGTITWAASKETAATLAPPLLDTDEKKEAFREFVRDSGGWTADEIAAWDDTELNALLLQWIAGDVREAFGDEEPADWNWEEYQKDSEAGRVSSRLFKGSEGALYFDISN